MIKKSADILLNKLNKIALTSLLIVAVSLSFGIPLTGKSMIHSANKYMESNDALQYEYKHPLGVDREMIDQLFKLTGHEGFGVIDADSYVFMNGSESVVRVFSYSTTTHKDLTLIEGNLPSNEGETVIDQRLKDYHNINIGDDLEIKENSIYLPHNTKVVGIVSSNLYMNLERGYSDLGMGRVEGFAYSLGIQTKKDQFTSVRFYDELSDSIIDSLQKASKSITTDRFNRIASPLLADLKIKEFKLNESREASEDQFDAKKRDLEFIQLGLQDTHSEIESALSEMANDLGLTFGPQSLQTKLETLIRLIDDKETNEIPRLNASILEFANLLTDLQTQIDVLNLNLENVQDSNLIVEIENKIIELQQQLDIAVLEKENLDLDLMGTLENINLYRNEFTRIQAGIETYSSNYENYQGRFVSYLKERDASTASYEKQLLALNQEREGIEAMESGDGSLNHKEEVVVGYMDLLEDSHKVLKVGSSIPNYLFLVVVLITISICYTEKKILHMYFLKVWLASTALGYSFGYLIVSKVVFALYKAMYQTPNLSYTFDFWIFLKPLVLGFISTFLVHYVMHTVGEVKDLRKHSFNKHLRKPKFSIIEKISNLTKLRIRTVFRNKLLVLILCLVTSVLLGLLSASVAYKTELLRVIDKQYTEVLKYDGLINVSDSFNHPLGEFKDTIQIGINKTLVTDFITTIYTFPDNESIKQWIRLNNVSSDNSLNLIDGFVVITEKLATTHRITPGASIEVIIDGKIVDFVVSGISENQLGHAIYMSDVTYENSGLDPIKKNGVLFKYDGVKDVIIDKTLAIEGVKSISFKEDLVGSYKEMISSYNLFILFPIIISILSILSTCIATTLILKSKRKNDLCVLRSFGYPMEVLLKERFLDGLIFNIPSVLISLGFSTLFYRYLVLSTQVPELIINMDPNFLILFGVSIVSFVLMSFLMWWFNQRLSIGDID